MFIFMELHSDFTCEHNGGGFDEISNAMVD